MTWCADKAYGSEEPTADVLEKRFAAVCGGSYLAHILASDIHGGVKGHSPNVWDDPFFESRVRGGCEDSVAKIGALGRGFDKLARRLKKVADDRSTGDLGYAYQVAQTTADRYGLYAKILGAYRKKDRKTLLRLAKEVPAAQRSVRRLADAFRKMWLSHNKPLGMETIQGRFGMIDSRYREMATRIREFARGKVKGIPEFDTKCPPRVV
jgi:hypothetical protein